MNLGKTTWSWSDLLAMYRVPDQDVYILGCFARHVTVYSQQVRALNLISALRRAKSLESGMRIAVIGGGAGGLMASVAAAYHGASVTIIDRLSGPMRLQSNSQRRFIHPYIYDWPRPERQGIEAQLPFFPWKAGYAFEVAHQIKGFWKLQCDSGLAIQQFWGADHVAIDPEHGGVRVAWTEKDRRFNLHNEHFKMAIVAAGFGLEPTGCPWQRSYWSNDDLDDDFLVSREQKKVLVSGVGDGGLVDVMRLCLRDFRHDTIEALVNQVAGIDVLQDRLLELHNSGLGKDEIHRLFWKIVHPEEPEGNAPAPEPAFAKQNGELLKILKPHLRSDLDVSLAIGKGLVYGPGSSILHRLIVSQLMRLEKIEYVQSEIADDGISFDHHKRKYVVKFVDWQELHYFDAVVQRHGPKPRAVEAFTRIYSKCADLERRWAGLSIQEDHSRRPQWDGDEYTQSTAFQPSAGPRSQVHCHSLRIWKGVREDGNCSLHYEFDGLAATGAELTGVSFSIGSPAGAVGRPVLNRDGERLGVRWLDDAPSDQELNRGSLSAVRDRVSRRSGTFLFGKALQPNESPASFGFELLIRNGHARSKWEFDQVYRLGRKHDLTKADVEGVEYVVRSVGFSIGTLRITLNLPESVAPELEEQVYRRSSPPIDIFKDGLLRAGQDEDEKLKWELVKDEEVTLETRPAPNSWELSVAPKIGFAYGLQWRLPDWERDMSPEERASVVAAANLRSVLRKHAEERSEGLDGDPNIRRGFTNVVRALDHYRSPGALDEQFYVGLMTYDDDARELRLVEGAVNGRPRDPASFDLRLPYGLGISGACFKEDRGFGFSRSKREEGEPGYYLPVAEGDHHEDLAAFPLRMNDHKNFPHDRARHLIGVIHVGSSSKPNRIATLQLEEVQQVCRQFVTMLQPVRQSP